MNGSDSYNQALFAELAYVSFDSDGFVGADVPEEVAVAAAADNRDAVLMRLGAAGELALGAAVLAAWQPVATLDDSSGAQEEMCS